MHDENLRHEGMMLLAGGIAHDLNNLLMSISGNAELALMDTPDDSPSRECLHDIGLATRRAVDRCNEMMVYAGRRPLALTQMDPAVLLRTAVEAAWSRAPSGVAPAVRISDGLPAVAVDHARMKQVLEAIAANALSAVGPGPGTVTAAADVRELDDVALAGLRLATTLPTGRYVCLEIRDTGSGMDDATLRRMFDPYFSTSSGRRGLGLAWALGIVSAHGGALEARSTPGEGTVVRIYLLFA